MTTGPYDVPPQNASAGPAPAGPAPTGRFRPNRALGIAASVMLGLVVAADLFGTVSDVWTYRVVADFDADRADQSALDQADRISLLASGVYVALVLVAAAVFITWLWRARSNAEFFCDAQHRRSRGWVIVGWFVPVVSLWFPKMVVDDIVAASNPNVSPRGDWIRTIRSEGVVLGWWATWIGMWLTGLLANSRRSGALAGPTPAAIASGLQTAAAFSVLSTILCCASAVFLTRTIALVDRRQTSRPPMPWWHYA
jgi:hypothetical protein